MTDKEFADKVIEVFRNNRNTVSPYSSSLEAELARLIEEYKNKRRSGTWRLWNVKW